MIISSNPDPPPAGGEVAVTDPRERPSDPEPIPRLQRLYDNPFLLLIAGLIVMFVIYTGWGMFEILTLPTATLP